MISLEQALDAILSRARVMPEETLPLQEALGRFLGREVVASCDSPRFDNSAVDGFALRAADTGGASPERPVALRLLGTVAAGQPWAGQLAAGAALRIMTGAAMPAGADALLMLEDARVDGEHVLVPRCEAAGEHVRRQGHEFRAGEALLPAATPITPPVVALLASMGLARVTVPRAPRVAVITTGTEVVAPGTPLGAGQIYDANRAGLLAALGCLGIEPGLTRWCPDDVTALGYEMRQAFESADVVITTGGVSMGDFDYVRAAAASSGLQPVFWKIAMKPGKPTFFATFPRPEGADGLLFGLAGNPVGALLSFQCLVRPALQRMMGAAPLGALQLQARLATSLGKAAGRLELVRGRLRAAGGELQVMPIAARESHMILGLARADCVLRLPQEAERVEQGALVEVTELRWQ